MAVILAPVDRALVEAEAQVITLKAALRDLLSAAENLQAIEAAMKIHGDPIEELALAVFDKYVQAVEEARQLSR